MAFPHKKKERVGENTAALKANVVPASRREDSQENRRASWKSTVSIRTPFVRISTAVSPRNHGAGGGRLARFVRRQS
jgi:hypothetical protein